MKFISKLNKRFITEEICQCKMFWCVPCPHKDNSIDWNVMEFDSNDGDDLSNWLIVLHKMKKDWEKDFEVCKNSPLGLPRGIMADGFLYHGNNLPKTINLSTVAFKMGGKLGSDVTPIYDRNYGINKEDLSKIEQIIGQNLHLQYTE